MVAAAASSALPTWDECDDVGRGLCSQRHLDDLDDLERTVRRQTVSVILDEARAVRMTQRILVEALTCLRAEPRSASRRKRRNDLLRRHYITRRMIAIYVGELERRYETASQ